MNSSFIDFTLAHAKLASVSLIAIALAVAEGVSSLPPDAVSTWENLGFKGCLIAAIIYLVREGSKERALHQKVSEEREERVVKVIEENTEIAVALLAETKRQTGFFDSISADVVKSALRNPVHPHS